MRVRIPLVVLLLCLASSARAQNVEVFGGYSYLGSTAPSNLVQTSANGWNAAVAANYKSWGVVADFSGHQFSASPSDLKPVIGSGGSGTMFLFGPQYSVRRFPRVTPFVHALLGVVQGSTVSPGETVCGIACFTTASTISPATVFGMALGGGIDLKVRKHVAIRLIQADYVRQDFSSGAVSAPRISAGIIFRLGKP